MALGWVGSGPMVLGLSSDATGRNAKFFGGACGLWGWVGVVSALSRMNSGAPRLVREECEAPGHPYVRRNTLPLRHLSRERDKMTRIAGCKHSWTR